MNYSVGFSNLPFEPDVRQVIYVESTYDISANAYIRNNYDKLIWLFKHENLEFIYLPMYFQDEDTERKAKYYAPYLTSEILENAGMRSSMLLDYMSRPENKDNIPASFLFGPKEEGGEWIFRGISVDESIDRIQRTIQAIKSRIEDEERPPIRFQKVPKTERRYDEDIDDVKTREPDQKYEEVQFSLAGEESLPSYNDKEPSLEETRNESVEDLMIEIQNTAKKLRMKGISMAAIQELILKIEPVSRLFITNDNRIYLPEYNNIEIEMSALPKAVFFLFLNNPEGIVLKRLEEHHSRLVKNYSEMSGGLLTPKMEARIKDLEVYGNNQLNVILARIKKAFCTKFDERLARHYYIDGKKGEPYKISLSQELIYWEDGYNK